MKRERALIITLAMATFAAGCAYIAQTQRTNLDYRFTGQYFIDFLFLLILVIHICKIKYLQDENRRLWKNLSMLLDKEKEGRETLKDLTDLVEKIINSISSSDEDNN